MQFLKLKGEDDQAVILWLHKKVNKYTSHGVQTDILKVMVMHISKGFATCLQQSPLIAMMMDETADVFNSEQITVVV